MVMEKRMGKRGQEGVTLTTLLLIILGVVVVAIIILGFTTGFGFIFDKFKLAPGQDLQAVVTGCELAASNELRADYCSTFKEVEINGEKQFVNCEDSRVQSNMGADSKGLITCSGSEVEDFCKTTNQLKESDWDKVKVNGRSCAVITEVGFEDRSS